MLGELTVHIFLLTAAAQQRFTLPKRKLVNNRQTLHGWKPTPPND